MTVIGATKMKKQAAWAAGTRKDGLPSLSHYYKIILPQDGQTWHSIAFIVQNHNGPHGVTWADAKPDVLEAVTTIEAIEHRAEMTFHPDLDRTELIQSPGGPGWDFDTGKQT